jgi:hypothetical protein
MSGTCDLFMALRFLSRHHHRGLETFPVQMDWRGAGSPLNLVFSSFFFFFPPSSPSPLACPLNLVFSSLFFLLLPHLTHALILVFFFSSSSPSPLRRWYSSSPADLAVTHHLRSNHIRRRSLFSVKPNRKTQTQPKKPILMHQTPFLMPQNSILMPQKSFFNLKLKPRF